METGKVINRISNRLRRRSAALQETLGMSGAQGNILNFILVEGQKHSIYQKDIEKEFGLRPSTATEVLKALEKKELICRVSEKQDARLKRIEFTSKAEEIRHLIAAEIGESESILLKGITEEERQIFIEIGERMLKETHIGRSTGERNSSSRLIFPSFKADRAIFPKAFSRILFNVSSDLLLLCISLLARFN